jgi:3-oxoacyl-[acyl-carrier protein] reductase
MIPIDLTGKTALITGGGQGLGAASCALLAEAGARVVVNYFADQAGANRSRAEQTAGEIGENAIVMEANVCGADSVTSMVDAIIEQCGGLDIVVNNAAIIRDRTLAKMTDADWQSVLGTDLTGVFNVCRAAAKRMNDGGRIVNMTSISGVLGFFGQCNYAAAKAGVIGITKVLSKELAKRGITVNAVAPGLAMTEMAETIPDRALADMTRQIPLGRCAERREIAQVVLFLCSDLASYVTGQTLHVNGGWFG